MPLPLTCVCWGRGGRKEEMEKLALIAPPNPILHGSAQRKQTVTLSADETDQSKQPIPVRASSPGLDG